MPGVHCLPPDLRLIFQKSAKHKIRVIRVILNLSLGPGPGDRFLPDYDAVFGFQVGLVGGPDAEEGVPVVEHHHIAVYAQMIGSMHVFIALLPKIVFVIVGTPALCKVQEEMRLRLFLFVAGDALSLVVVVEENQIFVVQLVL